MNFDYREISRNATFWSMVIDRCPDHHDKLDSEVLNIFMRSILIHQTETVDCRTLSGIGQAIKV